MKRVFSRITSKVFVLYVASVLYKTIKLFTVCDNIPQKRRASDESKRNQLRL